MASASNENHIRMTDASVLGPALAESAESTHTLKREIHISPLMNVVFIELTQHGDAEPDTFPQSLITAVPFCDAAAWCCAALGGYDALISSTGRQKEDVVTVPQ